MLNFISSLTAFIAALGILVTVHELGHFLIARYFGVTVKRFSIGFGSTIWRRQDRRGTEYVIAAIPLGGYVNMLDDRFDTIPPEYRHKTFNHKTIGQRAAIIAAGPVFNFIFSICAYWLVFIIGVPSYRPIIGDIIPNSIIATSDISSAMEIKSIDDVETPDWDSVRLQLIEKIGNSEICIGVSHFGNSNKIDKKILKLRSWSSELDNKDPIIALGIIPLGERIEPIINEVQSMSSAAKAGLKVGDKIIKIDDELVNDWPFVVMKVRDNPNRALRFTIERNGIMDITLIPEIKVVDNGKIEGFIGVRPKVIFLPDKYKIVRQFGPLSALTKAGEKTWQLMRLTVNMLIKILTGDIKFNHLSGPLSIAKNAGISAGHGLIYYLMFLALVSINLGIINLFPLLVLDGGHLLFLAIEKLKGNAVSEKVQKLLYRICYILLVILMGLAIFNDLTRLW